MLGAQGPKHIALAAEIGDGWLPMFFKPKMDDVYQMSLANGFARPRARRTRATFEVAAWVPFIPHDNIEAADMVRPAIALYVGGMSAPTVNFHGKHFIRMGYEAEIATIQRLYLNGHNADAVTAVPTRLVEDVALIGERAKIRDEV